MSWTTVSKPGPSTWTDSHPQGKEQYDESSIIYDDADVFYDGVNPSQWTDVAKPSNGGFILTGMATGLLMPLTYSRDFGRDSWVRVAKPT